ncbi:MAG: insulinase family protein [Oscillospiraceae bacterium]|nr:insulinase family protein [Oscillospiraceae bacterium]
MAKLVENQKLREKYYYFRHESGLDIYVAPKNHASAYALFGTKYGSIDNKFKTGGDAEFVSVPDGIAHFLEHKLFENENGINADQLFAATGANSNAYTAFEKTCYLFSCSDNGEKFEQSLKILLDFVTHPYFTEESIQKEQGIIGQEIRMYDDSPSWQVYFLLLSNMYQKHSVRLDIAGTVESIFQITPEILYKCHSAFYNLNNMILCVAGNVTPEQVKKVADMALAPAEAFDIERYKYDEPEGVRQSRVEKKLKVSKPLFHIGIKDPETGLFGNALAKKSAESDILLNMAFGKSSGFYTRLYNLGKINNKFEAGAEIEPEFSHFILSGESDDPDYVMDAAIAEFESKIKNGLDRQDFERFKKAGYADSVTLFDSTENIANSMMNCLFRGYDILDLPEIIGSVKFEDVERRLDQIFKKENFIMSVISPI